MALKAVLQSERVHDRSEHADVVGLRAIHAVGAAGDAAEDVAAAHRDGHLHAVINDVLDLLGQVVDDLRIDAITVIAHERLARKLQQNAMVLISLGGLGSFFWHECPFQKSQLSLLYCNESKARTSADVFRKIPQ